MNVAARELLGKFPDLHRLFVELDEGTRKQLESIAVAKTLPAGTVIGDVSEVVEGAYLIVEGAVRLESLSPDGERLTFGTLTAGEIHGVISSIDDMPSIHFATVIVDATVVFLPRAAFRGIVFSNARLCEKVMMLVCERTRCMCLFNNRLAFLKPLDRVAQCLWSISTGIFSVRRTTPAVVDLQLNQYELSSMLSLSRQRVNRALKWLECQGVITISYNRIRINNLEKLGAFGRRTQIVLGATISCQRRSDGGLRRFRAEADLSSDVSTPFELSDTGPGTRAVRSSLRASVRTRSPRHGATPHPAGHAREGASEGGQGTSPSIATIDTDRHRPARDGYANHHRSACL